jgi:hypothetical protein
MGRSDVALPRLLEPQPCPSNDATKENAMPVLATCLGHPRIGIGRELKKALEAFWSKKS